MTNTASALNPADWTITGTHDSREVELTGDRVRRVPGSGVLRPCDLCGAGHEVHVTVTDWAGSTLTVGTSCSKGLRKARTVKATADHEAPVRCAAGAGWAEFRFPSTGEVVRITR